MAKQTNEQRYKTAEERVKAFMDFYGAQKDGVCKLCLFQKNRCLGSKVSRGFLCYQNWLALEAEEKLEPCPFCGGETHNNLGHISADAVHYWVDCINSECMYRSAHYTDKNEAIAAHNRVARAVRAAKESEVKHGK